MVFAITVPIDQEYMYVRGHNVNRFIIGYAEHIPPKYLYPLQGYSNYKSMTILTDFS